MNPKSIKMGNLGHSFNGGQYQSITFCVTEECNLRCKYCYMTHKNSYRRMSFDIAKKAVDYCLAMPTEQDAVVWDFIGGEPTLEMDLIDKLCDYIKAEMFRLRHPWRKKYMFSFSTNGILYGSEKVQNYIRKNSTHVSFGITIDGTKAKHDLQRVKFDGSGSYDDIIENVKLWHSQYPTSTTKVTFASDDLKYLKDSIIHLWELGLDSIPANVVFEDVWKPGDDIIFEDQLKQLADYVIDNELWCDYSVRFFDPAVGFPLGKRDLKSSFCGSGRMLAFDCDGNIFPCIRFLDFCMAEKDTPRLTTGSLITGIDEDVTQTFQSLSIELVSDDECLNCPVAYGCMTCAGNNYCYTESHTIFKRTKYHCLMHKAQVRANEYFWSRLSRLIDVPTPREVSRFKHYERSKWNSAAAKYLYFVLDDGITPHCSYSSNKNTEAAMEPELISKGIEYARVHNMIPVFLGDAAKYLDTYQNNIMHVCMTGQNITENMRIASNVSRVIPIYDKCNYLTEVTPSDVCILLLSRDALDSVEEMLDIIQPSTNRINIIKQDYMIWDSLDLKKYEQVLDSIRKREHKEGQINLLEFRHEPQKECGMGISEITLAPNGKFYECPAAYFSKENSVGDIDSGFSISDSDLYSRERIAKCRKCDVHNCRPCFFCQQKTIRYGEYAKPITLPYKPDGATKEFGRS